MFGKTGLNAKLRKLFAKIQKEFDYPKVYAVRCTIQSEIHTYRDPTKLTFNTLPKLEATIWPLQTSFPLHVHSGAVEDAGVQTVQPLSEIETDVVDVTCWQEDNLGINQPDVQFPPVPCHDLDYELRPAPIRNIETHIKTPEVKDVGLIQKTWLRSRLGAVRFLPFRMRVYSMRELNKRLIIRYRGAVLKTLGLKPTEVKFVGVCFGLPKMPLKLIKYDKETEDGYDYVEARPTGAHNIHMGHRVWIIIRRMDDPRYIPVTLREE